MVRPRATTDDEILAAAKAVFLEKGILATVEEVAARCHVGEATVFRRFPTKLALFHAAMDTSGEPEWAYRLGERKNRKDVRANLLELANDLLYWGRKRIPLVVMKFSNPTTGDRQGPPAAFRRGVELMTDFMAAQVRAKAIRLRDPRVAARIFMGTVMNTVFLEAFAQPSDGVSPEQVIEGLVDLLCERREKTG